MQTGIYVAFAKYIRRGVKLGTCSPLVVRFPPQRVAPRFNFSEHTCRVLYLIRARRPYKKVGKSLNWIGETMEKNICGLINDVQTTKEIYERKRKERNEAIEHVQMLNNEVMDAGKAMRNAKKALDSFLGFDGE